MLFNPDSGETKIMRLKEDAHDYRDFPDPDLLPIIISDERKTKVRDDMPVLPKELAQKFTNAYGLSD